MIDKILSDRAAEHFFKRYFLGPFAFIGLQYSEDREESREREGEDKQPGWLHFGHVAAPPLSPLRLQAP